MGYLLSKEHIILNLKPGDLVRYTDPRGHFSGPLGEKSKNKITGLVVEIISPRWVKIKWSDDVVLKEHINDVEIISEVN